MRAVAAHMRGLTWQRYAWLVGFVFDVPALAVVYPGASWRWVLGLRVLGVPLQPLTVWYARRPGVSDASVMALSYGYTLGLVALLALQGLALGGMESPWVLGVLGFTFAGSLVADLRPGRVLHAVASWFAVWVLVLALGARWFPEVSAQWRTLRAPLYFLGFWGIIAAVAAGSVHFGRRIASLRRELSAARQLARYRLQARIGAGGMNEVWLAWDDDAKRNVALKILHRDPSSDAVRRFQREAAALQSLASEHTVRVLDAGASDDGVLYIALEHLDGSDLERLVTERGALHPARAVSLLRQACAALAEAHARGIVHRDVKPSNLFVTRHPRGGDLLKVLDFGIARRTTGDEARLTLDGDAVGTPHFMAPETLHGAEPDAQVDVYGLGATLYYLVTAARPFDGLSGAALLAAVAAGVIVPPSARAAVPAALDAVILRCLARDRGARYAGVGALDEALAALQGPLLDALLDEGDGREPRTGDATRVTGPRRGPPNDGPPPEGR
jgi:serine/threonine-protein kinase